MDALKLIAQDSMKAEVPNIEIGDTFTVRRVSYGVGVERVFPIHSPNVKGVKLVRKGHVRRAKLYYLRDRVGKAAKLREKIR